MKRLISVLCVVGWLFMTYFGLAAESSAGSKSAGTVTIAKNGRALMDIVVPDSDVIPSEKTAAEELAAYLQKITGATFKITPESTVAKDAPGLYVGNTLLAQSQGIETQSLGTEESILRTSDNRIILAGGRPRGTLYAVYLLLENELGCRWYTPWYEKVPHLPICKITSLDSKRSPKFRMRDMYTHLQDSRIFPYPEQLKFFSARNRLNGADMGVADAEDVGRGWNCAGPGNHSFWYYVPASEYFEKHPEYFPMRNGKRVPSTDTNGQMGLCLSNPELPKIVAERVKAEFRKNPAAEYVSVSINDGGQATVCDCDVCRGLAKQYGGDGGLLLYFINQVADEVKTEFPDKWIVTLIYNPTKTPPVGITARDNVIAWVCAAFYSGLAYAPGNGGYSGGSYDNLTAWAKCASHVWVWDYVPNCNMPINYFNPVLWKMDEQYRLANTLKTVDGIFQENELMSPMIPDMYEMRTWISAKLMEDPTRNLDGLIADFLAGYYGDAAPSLKKYVKMIEKRLPQYPYRMLDYTFMREAQKLFDAAEKSVRNQPIYLARVQEWRSNLDLAALNFRHQIVRDFIRQGGKAEKYPYPIAFLKDRILRTAVKSTHPYLTARWPANGKTVVDETKEYLDAICVGKEYAELPVKELSLPWEKVIDIMPQQISGGPVVVDSEAALGVAIRVQSADELPLPIGAYDLTTAQCKTTVVQKADIPGTGYHWYPLTFTIGRATYIWLTKSWQQQIYTHMLYNPSKPDQEWETWVSLKFTGPAYLPVDSKEPNAVYIGRVLLVEKNKFQKNQALTNKGANVKAENSLPPLIRAVRDGRLDVVKSLIDKGADVNEQDENGWTPLLFAVSENQLDVVKFLVAKGADVNAKSKDGFTPLLWARQMLFNENMVEFLKQNGAKT